MSAAPQTPRGPQGPADAATLKLVGELKALASDVLGRGIERMFDGADDMLFEMARRATNNKDQRIYFDTMRVVRLGRPKIGKIFREQIASGFEPDAAAGSDKQPVEISLENLSLQESKSLEESIAVSTMATKAENLYSHLLFELGRRLDWLIKEKNAPLSASALAPATISGAFRRSAEALDVEFDVELVIFKLFDRLVISDLGELYNRTLRFLDQNNVKAAAIGGAAPRPGGPAGMPMPPGAVPTVPTAPSEGAPAYPPSDAAYAPAGAAYPAGGGYAGGGGGYTGVGAPVASQGYGFAQPPMMDAATLNALRNLGSSGNGMGSAMGGGARAGYYGDVQLGTDLAMAASGQVVAGWEAPRAYAYVQRAGAVGQMFNELMQDPTLPAPLKPRFDQLRFSVIKSALKDASFFSDRQHPVRGLMNELTTLAASARASGMEALRRIEELVGQIQAQFDVAADEVRTQSALPGVVDEKTLDQFFAQQKEDARQRRQAIIERTRRVVAEELQLHTLSRKLPEGVWPLLNSGWAPLAALRLLRHGADSEGWREAMELLRRVLESVDARRPASRSADALRVLEQDLDARLREIGMLADRVHALLRSWRDAVQEVETAAVAGPDAGAVRTAPVAAPHPPRAHAPVPEPVPEPAAQGPVPPPAVPAPPPAALLDEIPFAVEDPDPGLPPAPAPIEGQAQHVSTQAEDIAPLREIAPPPDLVEPDLVEPDMVEPRMAAPVAGPVALPAEAEILPDATPAMPDPITLLDLLMVLSSWFRVYDHDRGQNRWLKVVAHHPADGIVTFAEFNGQNKLQLRTQVFLDDLVAGRAEPIDLGPAARRSLDAYLGARRDAANSAAAQAA